MTAAELIARLSVQGLDTFAADVGKASSAFDTLERLATSVFRAIEIGSVAGIGAFAAFTDSAVKEAAKVERLTLTFSALGHSMAYGRAEMEYLRQYATHSINTFDDVTAAALRLNEAGLNPNGLIRMVDILGGMLHPGAQGINQVADAFARIASGANQGVAMRSLSRVGIGYNNLRAEGVQMTAANHITSDPAVTISALQRIFEKKFGDMGKYLQDSMSVRFSNLQDAWNRLLDSFGQAWFPLINSILDKLTPFVDFLAKSGEVKKIGKGFANLFSGMGDGGFVRALAYGMAILEQIPGLLQQAGKFFAGIFVEIAKGLDGAFRLALDGISATISFVRTLREPFGDLLMLMRDVAQVARLFEFLNPLNKFKQAHDAWDLLNGKKNGATVDPIDAFQKSIDATRAHSDFGHGFEAWANSLPGQWGAGARGTSSRADEIMANFTKSLGDYGKATADPNKGAMFLPGHVEALDAAKQTATNTAHIAAHMETFKRFALGGGDRGKTGIAVSEFYARGGSSSPIQVDIRSGNVHLDRYMNHAMSQVVQGMRRAGALGGN